MTHSHSYRQARYHHRPLRDAALFIRVVTIKPGRDNDAIELTLHEQPLGSSHVCLSYVWGSATDTKDIVVNGESFAARENLFSFLLAARRQGVAEPLWIDAICINQHDISERNKQVQMMGQIYKQAKYVTVWLGLPHLDLKPLVTFRRALDGIMPATACASPKLHRHWQSCFQDPAWPSWSSEEKFNRLGCLQKQVATLSDKQSIEFGQSLWHFYSQLNKDLYDALEAIGHATYFSRAWIVQETILAQSITLIGESQMIEFQPVLYLLIELATPPSNGPVWWRELKTIETGLFFHTLINSSRKLDLDILQALTVNLDQGCQDPRDHIYSIRSLVKGGQGITVDYTDTLEVVFGKTLNFAWTWSLSRSPHDTLEAILYTRKVADYTYMSLDISPPNKCPRVSVDNLCQLDLKDKVTWVRVVTKKDENDSSVALVVPLLCRPRLAALFPIRPPPDFMRSRRNKWILLNNQIPHMLNLENKRSTPAHRSQAYLRDGELDYLLARGTPAGKAYQKLYGNV